MRDTPDFEKSAFMIVGAVLTGLGLGAAASSLFARGLTPRPALGMLLSGMGMIGVGVALCVFALRSAARRRTEGDRHTSSYTIMRCNGLILALGGVATVLFGRTMPVADRLLAGVPLLLIGVGAFLGARRFELWERTLSRMDSDAEADDKGNDAE